MRASRITPRPSHDTTRVMRARALAAIAWLVLFAAGPSSSARDQPNAVTPPTRAPSTPSNPSAAAQATRAGAPPTTRTSNPTVLENQKAGSSDWEIINPALDRGIECYASRTGVNRGEPIDICVSTREPRYIVDVSRTGWYGGTGARRYGGPIERDGFLQGMPVEDASTGLLECRWRDPLRLETRDGGEPWPSG